MVIPCQWKGAGSFCEGLAVVLDFNGKCGYIDKTGRLVSPCQWKGAGDFFLGQATVMDANGKWFTIDKTGKVVK